MADQIPGAASLGFGFNILGSYGTSSMTKAILTPASGVGSTYNDPYSGNTFDVPDNVTVQRGGGDSTQSAQVEVAQSQRDFQKYLSVRAGISGSYNGFSGEFDFAFGSQSQDQASNWYCVAVGDFQSWILLLQEAGQQQLSSEFSSDPDVLAMTQQTSFTPSNAVLFYRVFQKWGTHFIDQITMGGAINYFTAVNTSYSTSQTNISSSLSLEYQALFTSANAQSQVDWNQLGGTWASDRQVSWSATGGDTSLLSGVSVSPSPGDNYNQAFQNWAGSIQGSPAIVDFHLTPISDLYSGDLAAAIGEALTAFTNLGVYSQATFTSPGGSPQTVLIQLNGTSIEFSADTPPPTAQVFGPAQLVVFDGMTLETLANVCGYCYYDDFTIFTPWDQMVDAVNGLTGSSYIAVLCVTEYVGNYPSPELVNWLAGCGASLEAWNNAQNFFSGSNDEWMAYVMIGQQGLQPGSALETYTGNGVPNANPDWLSGNFFSNATAPLNPPIASGQPYTISSPAQSVTGRGRRLVAEAIR